MGPECGPKDTDGNYLAVCRAPEAAENGLRLDALGNLISITVLTSTLHWFETELLTREENLVGLMAVNRDLVGQAETFDHADRIVLDMDSSESPVHGQQEGSAYNGHFETVCYHPLFLFNDDGDCLGGQATTGQRLQRGRLGRVAGA